METNCGFFCTALVWINICTVFHKNVDEQDEKRLFAAETIAQYDYHQELMTIFRNRQDEGTKQPTGAL